LAEGRNRRESVVSEIRLYYEGDPALREGFRKFFGLDGRSVRLIAANGTPVQDFMTARKTHPEALNLLLLDRGDPRSAAEDELLQEHQDAVFWMVKVMESWFLADPDALANYYGKDFKKTALKANPNVEEIPKADVFAALKEATRETQKKKYHKTRHAPALLSCIDPVKVRKAAPGCERIFREVLSKF
jgi:hypothetical protein